MRKLLVGVGSMLALCCTFGAFGSARASDQQVIVEGSQHAGGTVRTSGHAVPLLHALEQVVPTTYSVNVPNAGAWADMPVSWHSGGSFIHALGELLSANPSLQARVDTDLHLVTVTVHAPLRQPVAAAPAQTAPATNGAVPPLLAEAAPSATPAVVQPPPQAPTAAAPETPPPASPAAPVAASAPAPEPTVWQLRPSDGSVRNALSRWADEAGWQFVWDVPTDFTIDAAATVHGTLEQALHQVVDALSHSQVPIQVVMYKGNRVLRVIPKGVN
ncbi:MAG TPA: toxin co-regulated pilus biosynthesis Q family protein [Trinickia sp.]|nr:toxin co-regulated pilus biosynthesis Q family protein [Trinickia sp.]